MAQTLIRQITTDDFDLMVLVGFPGRSADGPTLQRVARAAEDGMPMLFLLRYDTERNYQEHEEVRGDMIGRKPGDDAFVLCDALRIHTYYPDREALIGICHRHTALLSGVVISGINPDEHAVKR